MKEIIAFEGPGVPAEAYEGHSRLGRMRPLPSAQCSTFSVDRSGDDVAPSRISGESGLAESESAKRPSPLP